MVEFEKAFNCLFRRVTVAVTVLLSAGGPERVRVTSKGPVGAPPGPEERTVNGSGLKKAK
jgi:hypothetical protein